MHSRGVAAGATQTESAGALAQDDDLDARELPRETLVSAQARSGLSDSEVARIFRVHPSALASWRRHGVPRADAHRLQLFSEVLDALEACGRGRRLSGALRRPLPRPGTPSLVDLLARRDASGITGYLLDLNPRLLLTGRSALRL